MGISSSSPLALVNVINCFKIFIIERRKSEKQIEDEVKRLVTSLLGKITTNFKEHKVCEPFNAPGRKKGFKREVKMTQTPFDRLFAAFLLNSTDLVMRNLQKLINPSAFRITKKSFWYTFLNIMKIIDWN